jgi:hypothetical protein
VVLQDYEDLMMRSDAHFQGSPLNLLMEEPGFQSKKVEQLCVTGDEELSTTLERRYPISWQEL